MRLNRRATLITPPDALCNFMSELQSEMWIEVAEMQNRISKAAAAHAWSSGDRHEAMGNWESFRGE